MKNSDGRSILAALYLAIAAASLLSFFSIIASPTMGTAFVAPWWLLFAVFFGIAGMYKLLTISKGKSNNVETIHQAQIRSLLALKRNLQEKQTDEDLSGKIEWIEGRIRFFEAESDDDSSIVGKKSRNSNIEVRIWRDKKIVAIIFLFGLFIFTRF